MIANYHTHTYRCRHAQGYDEEYIVRAIAEGVKILGFADHAPYIYPNGFVSYYKMSPEEAPEYISSLTALREKYRDKIEIHIGFEAEYYPALWSGTLAFWRELGGLEYIILGQHYTREEYPKEKALHAFDGFADTSPVTEYVNTVIEAIKTRKFTYIAHPDVINYTGEDKDFFKSEAKRLVGAAVEYEVPLELNMLGLTFGRNYPNPLFWEAASELSPRVILGSDAHEPCRTADGKEITAALRFADKYKLNVIETTRLINPFE